MLFDQAGIVRSGQTFDLRVDSSFTAAELAAAGGRVALIHQRFADHYVELGRLVLAASDHVIPKEAVYLLRPQSAERSCPEAVIFARWIQETESYQVP